MTSGSLDFGASREEPEKAQTVVQRVTVQFHPNWPHNEGQVIESMAVDGVYRSQFETGISNGGLTAINRGDRWRWESRLFEGRYDQAPMSARPVYGAWNRRCDPYGGAIRFGSSYLRLRPEVTQRYNLLLPGLRAGARRRGRTSAAAAPVSACRRVRIRRSRRVH